MTDKRITDLPATTTGVHSTDLFETVDMSGVPISRKVTAAQLSAAILPVSTIIFRPGVASAGNAVATWPEVETFITALAGVCTVYVDDSIAACIVPGTANTECSGRTNFLGIDPVYGATLTIADGGRLRNVAQISILNVVGAPTAVFPLVFDLGAPFLLTGFGSVGALAGAVVAMIHVVVDTDIFIKSDGELDNTLAPTVPVITIVAAKTCRIFFERVSHDGGYPMVGTWVSGPGSAVLAVIHDGSIAVVAQSLFTGTFAETRTEPVRASLPSSGITAARPTLPFVGETYFDTTLGATVSWNGAAWVTQPLASMNSPTSTGLAKVSAGAWVSAASLLVNADVNTAAAIAGTKVSPDFGAQAVATTGALSASGVVQVGSRIIGELASSSPYSVHGEQGFTFAADASYTVAVGQYALDFNTFTTGAWTAGHTVTYPLPGTNGAYYKYVENTTPYSMTVSNGVGGAPVLLTGTTCRLLFAATGVTFAGVPFVRATGAGSGGGVPTGTGFRHVTAGVEDGAAAAVNLATADVTGVLPLANGGTNASTGLTTANGVVTSSGTALQQASNVLAGASFLSIGATPATTGHLRLPSVGSIKMENAGGTAPLCLAETDASDNLWFGLNSSGLQPVNHIFCYVATSHDVALGNAGAAKFAVRGATGFTESTYPITGGSGFATASVYGAHGMTVHAQSGAGATDTLSNAEYKNYTIKVTGTGSNIIKLPAATDATGYTKYIWNAGSGTLAVQDVNAVAAAATLAAGTGAVFQFATSAVKQLTAAFTVA